MMKGKPPMPSSGKPGQPQAGGMYNSTSTKPGKPGSMAIRDNRVNRMQQRAPRKG